MANEQPRSRKPTFELEVEKLLKQMPQRESLARGDDPPNEASSKRTTSSYTAAEAPPSMVPALQARGARIDLTLTWLIVLSAVGLGAALTQWPYPAPCDWRLGLYLGAVAAQMVTSGWGALAAWRHHHALAHVVALVSLFWGVVLAAEQVLPRVGYAAVEAAWRC